MVSQDILITYTIFNKNECIINHLQKIKSIFEVRDAHFDFSFTDILLVKLKGCFLFIRQNSA